jgi:hypothetical protein
MAYTRCSRSWFEGREFTPTEMRVIQRMLKPAFADLTEAWAPGMNWSGLGILRPSKSALALGKPNFPEKENLPSK